jgi:hypothetical protein
VKLEHSNADEVGAMLWAENVASVLYRYPDCTIEDMPGPAVGIPHIDGEVCYVYQDPGFVLTPEEVILACDCYSYQSCEHPDWETSEAKRAVTAIRESAISRLLPAPGHGIWGWDRAEVEKAQAERGQQFRIVV